MKRARNRSFLSNEKFAAIAIVGFLALMLVPTIGGRGSDGENNALYHHVLAHPEANPVPTPEAPTAAASPIGTSGEPEVAPWTFDGPPEISIPIDDDPAPRIEVLMSGRITRDGDPLANWHVFLAMSPSADEAIFASGNGHKYPTYERLTDEDGRYEITGRRHEAHPHVHIFMGAPDSWMSQVRRRDVQGSTFDHNYEPPINYRLRFTRDGQDIPHPHGKTKVRVNAYRNDEPMEGLFNAQLLEYLRGETSPSSYPQGNEGASIHTLWIRPEVDEVGFVLEDTGETRVRADQLYDGRIIDMDTTTNFDLSIRLSELPHIPGLTAWARLFRRDPAHGSPLSVSGQERAGRGEPIVFQRVPGPGTYEIHVGGGDPTNRLNFWKRTLVEIEEGTSEIEIDLGSFSRVHLDFAAIGSKDLDMVEMRWSNHATDHGLTDARFPITPTPAAERWISAAPGTRVKATLIRGRDPNLRNGWRCGKLIAEAEIVIDAGGLNILDFRPVE